MFSCYTWLNVSCLNPQPVVKHHSSRKQEEEEKKKRKKMMQRLLTHGTLWRRAAVRPLLVGVAVPEPTAALCCCAIRLAPPSTPTGRWLSTSASGRAAHQPKHQPPQEEPHSGATPQSQDVPREEPAPDAVEVDPLQDKSIGLFQRFKKTFKQYGKVLIPVHLVTSTFWFGTFYYAAMKWVCFFFKSGTEGNK